MTESRPIIPRKVPLFWKLISHCTRYPTLRDSQTMLHVSWQQLVVAVSHNSPHLPNWVSEGKYQHRKINERSTYSNTGTSVHTCSSSNLINPKPPKLQLLTQSFSNFVATCYDSK